MTDDQSEKIGLDLSEKSWIHRLQELATNSECSTENRIYMTGVGASEKKAILIKPDCKMWRCPHCAARNARQWIARIINHINKSDAENGWQMFTLTAHKKWRGENASIKNLRSGWKKLYNRMRYAYGVTDYVKVWERHRDGTFHLHGIVNNAEIDEKWLKKNAVECGMGYMVDIHEIDNAGQVAGYIAKYFMKSESVTQEMKKDYPKGLRRIEVSRNWKKLPKLLAENEFTWIINETRDGQLRTAGHYHSRGFDIIDTIKEDE